MTNLALTEEEVFAIEEVNEERPPSCFQLRRLIASHHFLQRRVEKLEGLLKHVTGEVPR